MKKYRVLYASILVLASLSLVACGNSKNSTSSNGSGQSKSTNKLASKQEITVVAQQEITSADPSLSTDVVSGEAITNTYEGIYRLNAKNELELAGATDVEVSKDGLTYTIQLRKDAKWSNGDSVTANDYVFAWQRAVDPATASEYSYIFAPVTNASEIVEGKKAKSELGIQAINDWELKVTLTQPTSYFKYLLSFTTFYPLNQKVVEKYGKDYASTSDKAVYNGPFTLKDFDGAGTDTKWTYAKNTQYWDKKQVKLNKVNVSVVKEASTSLSLFQEGKMDDIILTGELAQQMANEKEFSSEKQAGTYYLELNQSKADSPFKNENVRKAIAYAIDRNALAKNILGDGSIAAKSLVPEDMSKNPKTGTDFVKEADVSATYSKKKAKDYWAKAKKELGISNLTIDLLSSDNDSSKKNTEYIQSVLQENLDGVKVTTSPVPLSVRIERSNAGNFDMVLGGWSADYPDPSSFLDLFVTGNSYNRGRYSSKEYDQAVKAATTTNANDENKRWSDYITAAQVIDHDMGVVPLYQKAEAHMRNSKLKGVAVHPTGAHHEYKWAYLTK